MTNPYPPPQYTTANPNRCPSNDAAQYVTPSAEEVDAAVAECQLANSADVRLPDGLHGDTDCAMVPLCAAAAPIIKVIAAAAVDTEADHQPNCGMVSPKTMLEMYELEELKRQALGAVAWRKGHGDAVIEDGRILDYVSRDYEL